MAIGFVVLLVGYQFGEIQLHGSRHKRKHPKGRRKVGRKKRRMMRLRRALRT